MDNLYLAYEKPSNGAKPVNPFNELKDANMSQEWTEGLSNVIGNVGLLMNPIPNAFNAPDLGRVYNELGNFLSGGKLNDALAGVDRQQLNNTSRIAEQRYQDAASRYAGNQLNTGSQPNGGDRTQSDLDMLVSSLGRFFGNMNQPQNSSMSANEIIDINRNAINNSAGVARTAMFDRAGIDEKTRNQIAGLSAKEQERQQQFRIQNANVDAAIQKARDQLMHTQGMQQDMQTRLMNLNDMNQGFENTKQLNAQQMRDNENQRKYSLAESTLGNISNIYQAGSPRNLLAGVLG